MRYVLIANPAAGKKNPCKTVLPQIQQEFLDRGVDFTCHITEYAGHAEQLTRMEGEKGDAVRIYGVGGDGTLREIASGAVGMENVEIGIFPYGSGDDYIRTFGGREKFLSVEKQIAAESKTVDMIRSSEGLALNLCSLGMDAAVAYNMVRFKKMPLVTGSLAYDMALVKVLCGKIGSELQIVIDDTKRYEGTYLFALAGNGKYYGGGYCGAPEAVPDDGLLDFVLIKKPKFRKIPALVGLYKAGGHLYSDKFKGILTFCRGKKINIHSKTPAVVNLDGECKIIQDVAFEMIPGAVRFLVPQPDTQE